MPVVCFVLYIAVCFCVIFISKEAISRRCYAILDKKYKSGKGDKDESDIRGEIRVSELPDEQALLAMIRSGVQGLAGRITRFFSSLRSKVPGETLVFFDVGVSRFTSKKTSYGLFLLFGVFVFIFELIINYVFSSPSMLRGALIFGVFVIICSVLDTWGNYSIGLSPLPSVSILAISFFYGAAFWSMSFYLDNRGFDALLNAAASGKDMAVVKDKLNFLYGFERDILTAVMGLFLAVCITLGWQIASAQNEYYKLSGISRLLTFQVILFGACGSLGFMGLICSRVWDYLFRCTQAMCQW
jgi:hypothetical protein